MRRTGSADRHYIRSVVPSLAGWRTYGGAWINLLAFGFVALAGTWVVHQTEYAIVYGRRFQDVMATTPHRYYMAQLGVSLAAGMLVAGAGALFVLGRRQLRLHRLRRRLPQRYQGHVAARLPSVAPRSIAVTAVVLSTVQTCIYFAQENLESLAVSPSPPGFQVLLSPQHVTVIPLHLLLGLCGSLILWMVSGCLHRTNRAAHVARVLLALLDSTFGRTARHVVWDWYFPSLRLRAGSLGLRSPPRNASHAAC